MSHNPSAVSGSLFTPRQEAFSNKLKKNFRFKAPNGEKLKDFALGDLLYSAMAAADLKIYSLAAAISERTAEDNYYIGNSALETQITQAYRNSYVPRTRLKNLNVGPTLAEVEKVEERTLKVLLEVLKENIGDEPVPLMKANTPLKPKAAPPPPPRTGHAPSSMEGKLQAVERELGFKPSKGETKLTTAMIDAIFFPYALNALMIGTYLRAQSNARRQDPSNVAPITIDRLNAEDIHEMAALKNALDANPARTDSQRDKEALAKPVAGFKGMHAIFATPNLTPNQLNADASSSYVISEYLVATLKQRRIHPMQWKAGVMAQPECSPMEERLVEEICRNKAPITLTKGSAMILKAGLDLAIQQQTGAPPPNGLGGRIR